jgi:hypothetical protein
VESARTAEVVRAAIVGGKLRRSGRLDVRLFILLSKTVSRLTNAEPSADTFPLVIRIAEVMSGADFQNRFFDPTESFQRSFELLTKTIRQLIGDPILSSKVARSLWLYARPTFHALQRDARDPQSAAH